MAKIKLQEGTTYLGNHGTEFNPRYYQFTVLEISPSGEKIKVKYLRGSIEWVDKSSIKMLEKL
jgi:hypothetical protein